MPSARIMFIRHAEKPQPGGDAGVAVNGTIDDESLTPRGWQRAGALARFFCRAPPDSSILPATVFASRVADGSKSQRPQQTVTPLMQLLKESAPVPFVTTHLKDDLQPLMSDVLSRNGNVLVCWEHEKIPQLVSKLPYPPNVAANWPDERFDMVWVFDSTHEGWRFSQLPQLLLAGDSADPIR